jgi:hypothetical protein
MTDASNNAFEVKGHYNVGPAISQRAFLKPVEMNFDQARSTTENHDRISLPHQCKRFQAKTIA